MPESLDLGPPSLPIENSQDENIPAPIATVGTKFVDQLPGIDPKDFPNETSCHICMEPFDSTEAPESPVQLPCSHVMGRRCISKWLDSNNNCPLCRRVLFDPGFLRTCADPYLSVHLRTAGLSADESDAFQREWYGLSRQRERHGARIAELERENFPLVPALIAELRTLMQETDELATRFQNLQSRYQELIRTHRIPLPLVV